jgi:hypothetical protein
MTYEHETKYTNQKANSSEVNLMNNIYDLEM